MWLVVMLTVGASLYHWREQFVRPFASHISSILLFLFNRLSSNLTLMFCHFRQFSLQMGMSQQANFALFGQFHSPLLYHFLWSSPYYLPSVSQPKDIIMYLNQVLYILYEGNWWTYGDIADKQYISPSPSPYTIPYIQSYPYNLIFSLLYYYTTFIVNNNWPYYPGSSIGI